AAGRSLRRWPAGDLEALEAVRARPLGHVLEGCVREGRGQKAELHGVVDSSRYRIGVSTGSVSCVALHLRPAALARTRRDGVTDEHLVMAIGEGRVGRCVRRAAVADIGVDGGEQGAEGIGEAL